MGFGQPQNVTQKTTTQLTPQQKEIMHLAMPGIRSFAANAPERYQGSQIAPFNQYQTMGQNSALDASYTQGDLANSGANATNFLLGDIWKPESNPNLQGAIDAAVRPIQENLTRSTLPTIRGGAVAAGAFGGSRQGIAEGLASGEASQAIGDTASKVTQDLYKTNIDAQLKALGLLPQTQQAQLAQATTQSGVGDVQQSMEQQLLNQKVGNFNWDQYAPFLQSRELVNLLMGLPGGGTTTTANGPMQNPLMMGLGGAMAGSSLGSALFPGMGGGWGAGIGALLPFLMSDRRMKTDAKPVGKLDNGLIVYAYHFDGGATQLGLMADEVEKLHPEAVKKLGVLKLVDYSKAVE